MLADRHRNQIQEMLSKTDCHPHRGMCKHCEKENMPSSKVTPCLHAGSETMCGTLVVRQGEYSNRLRRLVVKVYGRAINPFVVFYQEKKFCNSCGFMKLRNCRVEVVDEYNFTIAPKDGDGNPLTFTADNEPERDAWIAALRVTPQSPLRSATSSLPRLEEDDEEGYTDGEDLPTNDRLKARPRRKYADIRRNSLTNLGLGLNRHALRLHRLADGSSRPQE